MKWNQQIKIGHFKHNITEKVTLQENVILKHDKKRVPSILLQEKVTILSHKNEQLIEILRI